MRLLHTSDWHIGQKLHGNDREEEHQLFFDWLIDTINERQIDVLLVSGDIFDVGFPANSALKLYYTFLTRLIQTHCKEVIITGGNHDYISTLEAPSEVLSALNIHIVGGAKEHIEEELIPISINGNNPDCLIAAIPFLRDKDIRHINAGESYEDGVKAINKGIVKHYVEAAEKAKNYACPVIAMGHLYVQGAGLSDSERDIHVGNLAGLHVDSFPPEFDYVALGHIHRPQKLNSAGTIRYSGSPIPLSFSERKDHKQIILLDIEGNTINSIVSLEVPLFRKLISFKGGFNEVAEQLYAYKGVSHLCDWAEVSIEEAEMDTSLRVQFEQLIETIHQADKGLRIVRPTLRFADNHTTDNDESTLLSELSIPDVFNRMLDHKLIRNQKELNQTFTELLDGFYHQSETE